MDGASQSSPLRARLNGFVTWTSLAGSVVVALAAVLVFNIGGDETARNADDVVTLVAALAAAVACLVAARADTPARRFWQLLGAACLLWAFGEGAWGAYEVVLGREVPVPSVADAGYLGAIPLAAAAMLRHPALSSRSCWHVRFVLDGLILALATFFLGWAFILEPIAKDGGSLVETLVGVAYPLGDVVIVSLIMIVLSRVRSTARAPLYFVLVGLLALSVADAGYAYLTEVRGYETGNIIDLGWVVGYLLLMLGAVRSMGEELPVAVNVAVPTWPSMLTPYLPFVTGLSLGGYRLLTNPQRDPVLWSSALLSLALMVVRQFVSFAENRALARDLEEKVETRTLQLAQREARFRSLVQYSSDVIIVMNVAGVIQYVSESVEPILGWNAADVVDRRLTDLVHPEDAEAVRNSIVMARANTEGTIVVDYRAPRRDGEWSHFEGLLTNRLYEESVRGLVLNSRDISVRRHLEESLRASEERLAAQVEELQELDRIKSDFVSTASHELRTPLTSILGQLEILADGEYGVLNDEELRAVEVMNRNGRRLLELIQDLLTLGRIESSGMQLRLDEADLRAIVEEVHLAAPVPAPDSSVTISVKIGPRLGTALVDRSQLERALLNLMTNAIKFTPEGSVTLRAHRSGDHVVFSVADTGIGIPPEEQDRLFTRFFRSSVATKMAIQGSGLGLVIAKTIVEAHGGTIDLVSCPGEGTEVTMTLPAPMIRARRARNRSTTPSPGRSARVPSATERAPLTRFRSAA